ncbi:hypothetical protein DVH24_023632 [Malus domestica]|uniref:Uncharacterized protein n=1 Tax=Malus domestica TaxID=3750 RepID=A0A498I0I3_MALDO|nr:hypothetical protein DVH24_023632 [Malus domestica]
MVPIIYMQMVLNLPYSLVSTSLLYLDFVVVIWFCSLILFFWSMLRKYKGFLYGVVVHSRMVLGLERFNEDCCWNWDVGCGFGC